MDLGQAAPTAAAHPTGPLWMPRVAFGPPPFSMAVATDLRYHGATVKTPAVDLTDLDILIIELSAALGGFGPVHALVKPAGTTARG
jgi:hypothetical protein